MVGAQQVEDQDCDINGDCRARSCRDLQATVQVRFYHESIRRPFKAFSSPQGTDRNDFASERGMNGRGAKMEAARPVRRLLQ